MTKRRIIAWSGVAALIVVLFCIPVFSDNQYWLFILALAWINVLVASSLRIISLTGELSLGQVGFMLVGAYASALLSLKVGLPVWLTMLTGGLLAAAAALILSYPMLRVKRVYFSILTLLVSEIFRLSMWYVPSLSGGTAGLSHIPPPGSIAIPGVGIIGFAGKTAYYYLLLATVLLSLVVLARLERSLGFAWMAIRQNDDLAESVGISVMGYKIAAFVIGCFFSGFAGALFAHFQHLLTTDITGTFGMLPSIYVVMYVVVGGQAKFAGPIIGAVVLTLIPELARPLKQYQPIIFGGLVIIIVFFMREGLIGLPGHLRSWRRKAMGYSKKMPAAREGSIR
jgi:branched-chain amino acid transport system permease protein